jgi:activator of HSP90 ATPase
MAKTITQKIVFKNTSPKVLYELYMDSKKHSAATGSPAKMSSKVGGSFSVHDGYISGKNLHLLKDALIVQSWRGMDWDKADADSTFLINLEKKGKDTVLHAVHANLPEKHADGINKGWHDFYWKPWKQYLAGKKVKRPAGM